MTYAKNSLGRSTGRKFNAAAMKREFAARPVFTTEMYRGFEISGTKHSFVGNWPTVYTSRKAAQAAIDVCLALRAKQEVA